MQQLAPSQYFVPDWKVLPQSVPGIRDVDALKNEPMLFAADVDFAKKQGGPLTNEILAALPSELFDYRQGYRLIIDTRVHYLMKGMYPAIPGWHGDEVPRDELYSQPNLEKCDPQIRHYMCLLSSSPRVSNTEFLLEPTRLRVDPTQVWKSVDRNLNAKIAEYWREGVDPPLLIHEVAPGDIIAFDQRDLHRATPCLDPGWRFFFRISVSKRDVANEIRKQTQVYFVDQPGW